MESKTYVNTAIDTVKDLLAEDNRELKGNKKAHAGALDPGYMPELGCH